MIQSKISKQLKDFEAKLNNMVDEKDIIAETKKELERIKESGLSREDKIKAQAYLQEFSKSFLKKDIITDKNLDDDEVEGARLLRVHMDRGYKPNDAKLNTENMKRFLKEPLEYTNGKTRSLNDTFGELDTELSNEAFSVYSKNGEKPSVAFRGSRTSPEDYNFYKDWAFNLESVSNPKNAQKSDNIKELEKNLEKVRSKYGGFKEFLGYSKGGNHALIYGNKEKVPVKAYNPHITMEHDLSNLQAKTTIMRTPLDPATMLLSNKNKGNNLKIKTIPALEQNVEPIGHHGDENFWDDTSPRDGTNPLKTKLSANMALRKLREELLKTQYASNSNKSLRGHLSSIDPNSTREQIDEAIKRQTLGKTKMKKVVFQPLTQTTDDGIKQSRIPKITQTSLSDAESKIMNNPEEYNRQLQAAVNKYGKEDTNPERIKLIKDFNSKYGNMKTKALKYKIAEKILKTDDITEEGLTDTLKSEIDKYKTSLTGDDYKMGLNTRSYISAKGLIV